MDQIFTIKMKVEEYLGKGEKLYAAFIDLDKAFDRVDREALWNFLKMYGVEGELLTVIQVFYREANACVKVLDGRLNEGFPIGVRLRQGCVMSP